MSNSLSILLIVGSAVIGPIEATHISNIDTAHACVIAHGLTPGTPMVAAPKECPKLQSRFETFPELCKRVMQEIGIEQLYAGVTADGKFYVGPWTFPDGSKFATGERVTKFGDKYIAGHVAQCIPTPRGYKK